MYEQRVRDIYDQLSPGYRRVADFLLNHYREAAFMTAAQVGRAASVDTTTVVRLAQRLGYPGYPELIAEVQEDVKRDLRGIYEPAPADQTPMAVFQRSLIEDRNNLDYALLHTEVANVEAAVEILETAPRIFVVGEIFAAWVAEPFAARLAALGFNARMLPGDAGGRAALSGWLQPGDAYVGIGLTAMTPGVGVALRMAQAEGARTIGIVSSAANPAASAAEILFITPAHTAGILPSLTAATAVLNALVQVLTFRLGDRAAEYAMRTDHLLQQYAQALREPIASLRQVLSEYNLPKPTGPVVPSQS
jgi:DNA-binding MurR/RpiR family transcriptional regulator